MRRHLLGIIALALLICGLVGLFYQPHAFLVAFCLRVGAVLGALWLALPQLQQLSRWLYWVVIIIALGIAVFSKSSVVLIPLLIALYFLNRRNFGRVKQPQEETSTGG